MSKICALFKDEKKWIKGVLFAKRDENGGLHTSTEIDANCYCLLGAVRQCYQLNEQLGVLQKLRASIEKLFPRHDHTESTAVENVITRFNDAVRRKYEDVIAVAEDANV